MTAVLRIGGLGLWSGPKPPPSIWFHISTVGKCQALHTRSGTAIPPFFKTLQSSCQSCPLSPKMRSSRTGRVCFTAARSLSYAPGPVSWVRARVRAMGQAVTWLPSVLQVQLLLSISAALDMAEVSVQVRFPTAALVAVRDSLVAASGWLGCSSDTVHVKSAVPVGPLDSSPGAGLRENSVGSPFWWPRARSLPWPHSDLRSTQFPVLNLTSASNSEAGFYTLQLNSG